MHLFRLGDDGERDDVHWHDQSPASRAKSSKGEKKGANIASFETVENR